MQKVFSVWPRRLTWFASFAVSGLLICAWWAAQLEAKDTMQLAIPAGLALFVVLALGHIQAEWQLPRRRWFRVGGAILGFALVEALVAVVVGSGLASRLGLLVLAGRWFGWTAFLLFIATPSWFALVCRWLEIPRGWERAVGSNLLFVMAFPGSGLADYAIQRMVWFVGWLWMALAILFIPIDVDELRKDFGRSPWLSFDLDATAPSIRKHKER